MKTAIYINDGVTQLVLTPETDFEHQLVRGIEKPKQNVGIYTGSFYECQGGWYRQGIRDDESLIIVMRIEADK